MLELYYFLKVAQAVLKVFLFEIHAYSLSFCIIGRAEIQKIQALLYVVLRTNELFLINSCFNIPCLILIDFCWALWYHQRVLLFIFTF